MLFSIERYHLLYFCFQPLPRNVDSAFLGYPRQKRGYGKILPLSQQEQGIFVSHSFCVCGRTNVTRTILRENFANIITQNSRSPRSLRDSKNTTLFVSIVSGGLLARKIATARRRVSHDQLLIFATSPSSRTTTISHISNKKKYDRDTRNRQDGTNYSVPLLLAFYHDSNTTTRT